MDFRVGQELPDDYEPDFGEAPVSPVTPASRPVAQPKPALAVGDELPDDYQPDFGDGEAAARARAFARNKEFVRPGVNPAEYSTTLTPADESAFRMWVRQNKVPFDPTATGPQDYDMRGFWKGLVTGDPHAKTGVDPNDKKLHYTDYWKTPYHETFSAESKFAGSNAPTWQGDKLVGPDGTVLFDDAAANAALSVGDALPDDYQPDFGGEPAPAVTTPKTDRTQAGPGASSPWVRGTVTGAAGSIEDAGAAADTFRILAGGDTESPLGKLSVMLTEAGKKGGGGYERQEPSIGDVHSLSEAYTYLAETTSSGLASTAPSLILGAAGIGLGGAAGGAGGAVVGGFTGSAVPSFISGVGGTMNDLRADPGVQEALRSGKITERQLANYALGTGALIGSFDAIGAGKLVNLTGIGKEAMRQAVKTSVLAAVRRGIAKGVLAEGGTEAAQQVLSEGAQAIVGGNLDIGKRVMAVIDSFLGGALVGAPVGGAGAAVENAKVAKAGKGGTSTPGDQSTGTPPQPAGTPPVHTEEAPAKPVLPEPSPERFGYPPAEPSPERFGPAGTEYPAYRPGEAQPPVTPEGVTLLEPGDVDPDVKTAIPATPAPAQPAAPPLPQFNPAAVPAARPAPGVTVGPDPDVAAALTTRPGEPTPASRPAPPALEQELQRRQPPPIPTTPGMRQAPVAAQMVAGVTPVMAPRPDLATPEQIQPSPPELLPLTPAEGAAPAPLPPLAAAGVRVEPVPRAMRQEIPGDFISEMPSGWQPGVAPAEQPAGLAPRPAPAEQLPQLRGNRGRVFDEVVREVADAYQHLPPAIRAQRIDEDLRAAHEVLSAQPAHFPVSKMRDAVLPVVRERRSAFAREQAAAGAPAQRERIAAEIAADRQRREAGAPERAQRREERTERLLPAEERLSEEDLAREGGGTAAAAGETPDEEFERSLDDIIDKAAAQAGTVERDPSDPMAEQALKAEAGGSSGGIGGGGGGKVGKMRGERDRPGSPQWKATRILRRVANAGLRQALRAGGAKTRWFARQWLSDAQLTEFNEHRFQWTEDIDPAIRREANPMRQVAEARSREAARRDRLARDFAPILGRLDRLARADGQAYTEFTQLMADSSALTVDPTRPLSATENKHLGTSFTRSGYQGRQAHPALARAYDDLVRRRPEIAGLWADIQKAMAARRELETEARVTTLVRALLDRENERSRRTGKPPVATGDAAASAIANRAISGQLTKADKELLSPSVQMAVKALVDAGTVEGTYLPFLRQGNFVVRWRERMQLPQGAQWVPELDGTPSSDHFQADESVVNAFVKSTLDMDHPNGGLIVRKIRAFKPGVASDRPVYRDEETADTYAAAPGKTRFEVEVQRDGMSLFNTQSEAEAAFGQYQGETDDTRLEVKRDNQSGELVPADIDEILRAATRTMRDELVDDATITLLDRTMKDAVTAISAGQAASARRLRRRNVSGADEQMTTIVDRYADASSGAIAKLAFLPDIDTGMRGMRASDEQKSRTDSKGQLARQQVIREWEARVANPNDHYRVQGSWESATQAALTTSYLTRLADLSAVLIDSTQPYIFGYPRLLGRYGPVKAARLILRAEGTIGTPKVAGRGIADTARSAAEGATRLGAVAARRLGVAKARGARFDRANHFDGIRASVARASDYGADLAKMLDELADVGLLSRDSVLEIKPIDPNSERGFNRVLEPLADLARQGRIAIDIRNQSVIAVAAYRGERQAGKTHAEAVEFARDAVRQTQFDSTHATSAPAFKLRGAARFPLQFKRFMAQSVVGITRMMQAAFNPRNMTPAQRQEWRRIFAAANLVVLAAAGVSGHPLAMVAGVFIQALAAAMGDPPREWELELEEWLTRMFAQEAGMSKDAAHVVSSTLMRGLPSGLSGVDISKRIGLGDLFVHGRPESFDTKGVLQWVGTQLLGAPGESLVTPLDALKAIREGNFAKVAELLTPKFAANVIRAGKGGPQTAAGEPLTREGYSTPEKIAKGLGFQPTREADLRRQRTFQYAETERRKVREQKLRDDFLDAPTYAQKKIAYRKIKAYNKTVPENAVITDESLKRTQKEALKEQELYGGMKLSKKTQDIGEAGRRLNPADRPPRKKIVEYEFD